MNRRGGRFSILFLALAAAMSVMTIPAVASDQEGCLLCHRLELRVADDKAEKILKVHDPPAWIHRELYCSDCHPDARNAPHPVPPGAAQCIGECHGKSDRAISSHRKAAFAGFTESHRRVSPGRSPCRLCHTASDRMEDRSARNRRCAGCHPQEYALAAAGPHGSLVRSDRFCVDCHPAHRENVSGGGTSGISSCGGSGCHVRVSASMRALVDHRGQGFGVRGVGKALLFFLLAFTGWAAGRALSPPPGLGGDRS